MSLRLENDRLNAREVADGGLVLKSYPRGLILGLTTRCNLDCVMCAGRTLRQRDVPDDVVDTIRPALERASTILWSEVGELFASPKVETFLELMQRYRPPESRLWTNLTLIEPYLEAVLDSGLTELLVSIDAATKETYESIRAGACWELLVENLERFQRRKEERRQVRPSLTFVYVAMNRNIQEMPECVELAKRHGVTKILMLALQPAQRPEFPFEAEALDPRTETRYYRETLRRGQQLGIALQDGYFNTWDMLDGDVPEGAVPPNPKADPDPAMHPVPRVLEMVSESPPACLPPWTGCVVQTNGKVRPTCCRPQIIGDLRTGSFQEVWNGRGFQELRKAIAIRDFSQCGECPLVEQLRPRDNGARKAYFDLLQANAAAKLTEASRKDLLQVLLDHDGGPLWRLSRIAGRRFLRARNGKDAANRLSKSVLNDMANYARVTESQAGRERELYLEGLNHLARSQLAPLLEERGISIDPVYTSPESLIYNVVFLSHTTPHEMRVNERYEADIEILNASVINWPTGPIDSHTKGMTLSYSWYNMDHQLLERDGLRTGLPAENGPFKVSQLRAGIKAYRHPGEYLLVWDLVHERVAWFADKGGAPLEVKVVIAE